MIWLVVGIGAAALIGGLVFNLFSQRAIEGVQTYPGLPGGLHTAANVNYPQSPPVGGEHNATWQNCGIYSQPLQNELAVHAMEHGAVWLTYQPDLAADQVEQLRALVRGKTYTLLSPYEGQATPVVVTAWGAQLPVERADDPRLNQFIAKYRQGPQTPEPGAVCIGGVGEPEAR